MDEMTDDVERTILMACKDSGKMKRGIVLSFDLALALLVFAVCAGLAAYYFSSPVGTSSYDDNPLELRSHVDSISMVLLEKGYLTDPLDSSPNTDGISSVLRELPSGICAKVEAYGIPAENGLVGYWKMDQRVGDGVIDYSSWGNGGLAERAPRFMAEGRSGGSVRLDGVRDYFNFGSSDSLNISGRQFTLSAWVKMESGGLATQTIISKGANFMMYVTGASTVTCTAGATSRSYTISLPEQWHHVVCTYNSSVFSIYTDGELRSTIDMTNAIGMNSYSLFVGARDTGSGATEFFKGYIDEVRVYNKGIDEDDIAVLYINPGNLAYSIGRENCPYSTGPVVSTSFPFLQNSGQDSNKVYTAVVKAWHKGS